MRSNGTQYQLRARHVILAVPRFIVRHLLEPWRERVPRWLDDFSYAPWMAACLHLKDRLANHGFALAWDNVLYDGPSLGYVVATHQALLDDGPTILTYYLPFTDEPKSARERLAAGEHSALSDATVSDLIRAHPDLHQHISALMSGVGGMP